jgi:hypothetical protein
MPNKDGTPLPPMPPSDDEFWDGEKFSTEIKQTEHKHKFVKINPTEIRCECGAGYSGSNIDIILKLFDKR